MSIPTPDEVATILATLRRIPGMTDSTTIGHIEEANAPTYRLARALRRYLEEDTNLDTDDIPSTRDLRHAVGRAIAEHGLRITTDPEPGELIGYAVTENDNTEVARYSLYQPTELDAARTDATKRRQAAAVAAVYLLPEGGKA